VVGVVGLLLPKVCVILGVDGRCRELSAAAVNSEWEETR
jgi:hypothetical protein